MTRRFRADRPALRPYVLALFAVLSIAPSALSRERAIKKVEVRSLVTRDDRDMEAALRQTVERELSGVDLSKTPPSMSLVLAASLTRLDTTTGDGRSRASAKVSVTLRDAKRGALLAILDASGTVEDRRAASEVETGAVSAAVRGALKNVPEAIARVQLAMLGASHEARPRRLGPSSLPSSPVRMRRR
jgi:hypothetical protein